MKVAVLVPGGVDRSGTERVIPAIVWLLERLARRHEVHVFAFNQEPEPAEWDLHGARVHNVGTVPGWRRRLFGSFATEHRILPFACIHGVFGWGGTYGAMLGWRHGIPVLFHPSGGEFIGIADIAYGMQTTLRSRLQLRLALAGASRVAVGTEYMTRSASAMGVSAQVVPLGVALDRWVPSRPRPRNGSSPAILLHVGDIRPVKDQRMLLAAASRLRTAGVAFELHMAGLDTMNGALQQSADALALDDALHWHGVLGRDALHALMIRADILLVSSRHEAEPMVVLEAAVAGVPTVGTAVGHIADWAPHAAVAVPVGDASAFAIETAALLADEPRRLALAQEAQRRALAIDVDYTAAAFERLYEEMVSARAMRTRRARSAPSSKAP